MIVGEKVLQLRNVIRNILKRFTQGSAKVDVISQTAPPAVVAHSELVSFVKQIPCFEERIEFLGQFEYSGNLGKWATKVPSQKLTNNHMEQEASFPKSHSQKVHYGCGNNLLNDWVNVDLFQSDASQYRQCNLLEKHPFPDESISFGFAEDLLEHFSQAESILFLSEIRRTLVKGGVLRLSYPSLEGVLNKHYFPVDEARVRNGEFEAYIFWDHIHFYSNEELKLVAHHLGFQSVEFVSYGESSHPELCGLDTRSGQIGLNAYVELTK